MPQHNRDILQRANACIERGDIEGFLAFCADDIVWTAVGEAPLRGKEAVRRWMETAYAPPPQFTVSEMFEEGDRLAALGEIEVRDASGRTATHAYCDVWRVRDGRLAELQAFVVAPAT